MERQYRDLQVYLVKLREAVRDLDALVAAAPAFAQEPPEEVGPPDTRPQLDRVVDALSHGDQLTVAEIAGRTRIPAASVRMVVYTHRDKFAPTRLSARRVLWSLTQECSL